MRHTLLCIINKKGRPVAAKFAQNAIRLERAYYKHSFVISLKIAGRRSRRKADAESRGTIYQWAWRQGPSSSRQTCTAVDASVKFHSLVRMWNPYVRRFSSPPHLSLARPDNNPDEISFALRKTAKRLWTKWDYSPFAAVSTKLDLCEFKRENDFLIRHGRSSDTEILNLRVRDL